MTEPQRHGEGLIDPPLPYQHPGEIAAFLAYIAADPKPPRSILEIGVWEGGTSRAFVDAFPGALVAGVDPAPWPPAYDQGAEIIVGRSQDEKARVEILNLREQWDLVFIDGDHSEDGTMQDLEFAKMLAPRWIAIHDITCRTHDQLDCWKVWDKIVEYAEKMGRETYTFQADPDWWGIGLIRMPEAT